MSIGEENASFCGFFFGIAGAVVGGDPGAVEYKGDGAACVGS